MKAALLPMALLAAGWVGDPAGLDLRPWLKGAGTRAVAVLFTPKACRGCDDAKARWQKLRARYHDRGLRVIVLSDASEEACAPIEWADDTLCGAGKTYSAYRAPTDRPSVVVWSWQGPVVARSARQLRTVFTTVRLPTSVHFSGRGARELRPALKAALRGTGKLAVARAGGPPPDDARALACPARHRPRRLALTAKVERGKLAGALLDPDAFCAVSRQTVSLAARPAVEAAAELVGRLIFPLVHDPEVPDLGAGHPARIGARPVEVPVEAQQPAGPLRPVAGGLVDPNRRTTVRGPGAGQSLASFAAEWVGTRYELDGAGKGGIDDKNLAHRLYLDVYGIDLTNQLEDQLRSGPEVVFDKKHPDRDLEPGDLLFFVSYAYLPRSVSVYLGGGKILTSQLIRGVVIDDAPKSVPHYLYLVARRPLLGARETIENPR